MTGPKIPQRCRYCDEPILAGERVDRERIEPVHFECGARAILGGLNHMKGTCSCCGGPDDPDPPGLTVRQAARAAYRYWASLTQAERDGAIRRPYEKRHARAR